MLPQSPGTGAIGLYVRVGLRILTHLIAEMIFCCSPTPTAMCRGCRCGHGRVAWRFERKLAPGATLSIAYDAKTLQADPHLTRLNRNHGNGDFIANVQSLFNSKAEY